MKIKVTYSQVKEALAEGFISPLNSLVKRIVKFFDFVALVTTFKGTEVRVVKVVKHGTKRFFFRVEKNGQPVSSTLFGRKYDAEKFARNIINLGN